MIVIIRFLATMTDYAHRFYIKYKSIFYKSRLGYCGKDVVIRWERSPGDLSRVYMYDNTNIYQGFRFIGGAAGRLVVKNNSGAAVGLTVVTGNHQRIKGVPFKQISGTHEYDIVKDVVIEEDVWIAANVTLLAGVIVGRGATVGAGAVCIKSVPPYAVVMGNPAKVVGFNFTPEEIVEHEKSLYPADKRIPIENLERNYKKYYLDRISEIKNYTKL